MLRSFNLKKIFLVQLKILMKSTVALANSLNFFVFFFVCCTDVQQSKLLKPVKLLPLHSIVSHCLLSADLINNISYQKHCKIK